jgi:aminoglycoside 6'-N-acetyltransferase I
MKIREITGKDKSEWISLRAQLWPRHDPDQLRDEVEKMLQDSNGAMLVAEHEGKIVGFIECSIRDKAPGCETTRIGYIEGWYVVPQFRRQEVGGSLVESGESWARRMGCTEMASDTSSNHTLSPAVHGALGYQEVKRKFYYRKSLQ